MARRGGIAHVGSMPGTRWLRGEGRGSGGRQAMLTMTMPEMGAHQYGMLPNPDGSWSMMHSPPESNQWQDSSGSGSLQELMQMLQQLMAARQGQGGQPGQPGQGVGNLGQGAGTGAGGGYRPNASTPAPTQGGYPPNTNPPPTSSAPSATPSVTPTSGPPTPTTAPAAATAPTFAWGLDE